MDKEELKNIDISLIALNKLGDLGFNIESFATILIANMIEDLYYERNIYDGSSYFDYSMPGNKHYDYLISRYKIGNEKLYKALIAREIGITDIEPKNINYIILKVTNEIIKKFDKKSKILKLND